LILWEDPEQSGIIADFRHGFNADYGLGAKILGRLSLPAASGQGVQNLK
jgi:hypothetical protein